LEGNVNDHYETWEDIPESEQDALEAAERLTQGVEIIALLTALLMPGRPTVALIEELKTVAMKKLEEQY
jgi:hypothetical protein